jgi:putative two-component system hydrogenase maturation factor HypX/HoxX
VLVRTGGAGVWLGQLRVVPADGQRAVKLPAATVLAGPLRGMRESATAPGAAATSWPSRIRYRRSGPVGEVTLDCYNGALATSDCRRLLEALRHATRQDTRVLVLRGGWTTFCNGIHLGVIEAADEPAAEAWANIRAINAVCRELVGCTGQVTVAALTGGAGAGGAMLAVGADVVVARDGVVLNPFYDIGLFGSELHTYTLPRRVGAVAARCLLADKLPVSAASALSVGLVDAVGPRRPAEFSGWLADYAAQHAGPATSRQILALKRGALARDAARMPLDAHEARELGEMAQDMFGDRNGFAAARAAFVRKLPATTTPARLARPPRAA